MTNAWSPAKCTSNIGKHGVSFEAAETFEWETALVEADTRHHYDEIRLRALGLIGPRVHVLIYTIRRTSIWIISLRKANRQEAGRYAAKD